MFVYILECVGQEIDIIFLVDGSTSITSYNFDKVRAFLIAIINAIDITSSRVGMVQFSAYAQEEFKLGEITDKASLATHIRKMRYLTGTTATFLAIQTMQKWFEDE